MGLFSKKACSFCGTESGVLSNRKLADGNICKDCRSRLSPYFDWNSRDTVGEIAAHLDYRERNRAELNQFRPSVAVGGAGKVFIDLQMGKFAVCRERELPEGNPDLFDLRGLRSCALYVSEERIDGDEDESDRFDYDFFLEIEVDHPFISEFSYSYNGSTVSTGKRLREEEMQQIYLGQKELKTGVAAFFSGVNRKAAEAYLREYAHGQEMVAALNRAAAALRSGQAWQPAPAFPQPTYPQASYVQSPAPVTAQQPVESLPAAGGARAVNFCPSCGTRVSGGAFCHRCGTKL